MATTWSCAVARQLVAGDLLDDEPVVGQVAVQGVDHPVAVEPDETRLVFLVAVGVGVPSGVEPVPTPTLAVVRRGQQAFDDPLVGVFSRVGQERIHLLDRGRQSDEVEAEAAEEGDPIGFGRGR